MPHTDALLLDVWQEVSRQTGIDQAFARIVEAAGRLCPVDLALLCTLDAEHAALETVAAAAREGHPRPDLVRTQRAPDDFRRLLDWAAAHAVVRADSTDLAARLPGLVPAGRRGDCLAASLGAPDGTRGILLFMAEDSRFSASDETLFRRLAEPISVALANDRRFRELNTLREAAEADRRSLLNRLGRQDIADSVVGAESGLREVMAKVDLVARADAPVLILGETGSGKEVVARAIHARSPRAGGPFLRVNCGAIPGELIDSELFGHERGSFTGAVSQRRGWFERADGGTLFMDEVGELSPAAQVRLLRILQDGSFERVGGHQQLSVHVRVVAATNRDLRAMVSGGEFREDLWYRIAVFPIRIPPLRERIEDIPSLATHFALRAAARLGLAPRAPTPADIALLAAYPWPGNVRELASVMERAAILGDGRRLEVAQGLGGGGPKMPPAEPAAMPPESGVPGAIDTLDRAMALHIEKALAATHGRIEGPHGAARLLAINPHTLRARMRRLGVDWKRYREEEE